MGLELRSSSSLGTSERLDEERPPSVAVLGLGPRDIVRLILLRGADFLTGYSQAVVNSHL